MMTKKNKNIKSWSVPNAPVNKSCKEWNLSVLASEILKVMGFFVKMAGPLRGQMLLMTNVQAIK